MEDKSAMHGAPLSRRRFLEVGVCGAAVLVLPAGCGDAARTGGSMADAGRFFDEHQYDTVRALTGVVIPEDQDPGAITARVADYVDFLLGAFQVDPPRIYAAGPFSGRHGGESSFGAYLPLSRVKEIAWRNHIEGSQGIPEREFNGPVIGLQEIYRQGIGSLDAQAREQHGVDFAQLEPAAQQEIVLAADPEFVRVVYDHTVEGMYAAPEYGGNFEGVGWSYIDYEGDRQPVGYNRRQVEEPDPGQVPLPADQAAPLATVEDLRTRWSAGAQGGSRRGGSR